MDQVVVLFLVIIALCIIIVAPIFLIAFIASQSRKTKQNKIINELPPDVDFYARVRFNSSKKNDAFFKFTSYECSGVLYVHDNKAYFRGTKKKYNSIEFDLNQIQVFWIGVQIQNGGLQWFSIKDEKNVYYFNADTGTTIFKLSKKGDTTRGIFDKLKASQSITEIGSIGKN